MAGIITGLELHEACTVGDYDALEDYLKSGRYDNYVNMKDQEWQDRTPLHWAASKGYVECARLLLEHGAQATARMSMGWTAAHAAAETGKLGVLRAIAASGAPLHRRDDYGDTPERVAQTYGHTECVKYLRALEEERMERKATSEEPETDSDVDTDHNTDT